MKLHLKQNPTLSDIQQYVRDLEKDRGFTNVTMTQNCLLLGEEVGELFKAIRKSEKMRIDRNSKIGTVEEEIADIIIFLCSIANRLDINIEQAFRDKEEINKQRSWDATGSN